VQPVGTIDNYPGAGGYVSAATTRTKSISRYSTFPSATGNYATSSAIATSTSLPLARGTRDDCSVNLNGTDHQVDTSVFFGQSACEVITDVLGITLDDLGFWNPSLNTTSSDCALLAGYSYCSSWGTPSGNSDGNTTTPDNLPLRV